MWAFQLQPKASQTALQEKGQAEGAWGGGFPATPGVCLSASNPGASRRGQSSPLCRPSARTMPLTHVALYPALGDPRGNPQASGRQQASSRRGDGLHADSSGRQPCQPAHA